MSLRWIGACLVLFTSSLTARASELAAPINIQAGGKIIDTGGVGYAAPFFGDFDGDGVRDLLIGEFAQGKLRIYRNVGTNTKPHFEDFQWFQNDAPTGRVPTG